MFKWQIFYTEMTALLQFTTDFRNNLKAPCNTREKTACNLSWSRFFMREAVSKMQANNSPNSTDKNLTELRLQLYLDDHS